MIFFIRVRPSQGSDPHGFMKTRYPFRESENKIYQLWEKGGYFKPDFGKKGLSRKVDLKKKGRFCIIMPPPNANAPLHIGHAVFVTLEDIMIRYHRMKGNPTLWLPGADHAGFETQVVFEKHLEKKGQSRFQFSREALYKMLWDFTQKNKKVMEGQLKKLGASCDWTKEKFTLDPDIIKIVYQTFKKLFDDGLIYRGKRVINWCVKHQTSLSDLEVNYQEKKTKLTYIKYHFWSSSIGAAPKYGVIVATTRPETMLGDTAIAVNPKDKRYQALLKNKIKLRLPLTKRIIPLIADEAIDPSFGTGAVKVTPAHDPTDFEIGERHNLEIIKVIDEKGEMTKEAGESYSGLKVLEARQKVIEDLKKLNLIEKEEDYSHSAPICYKCQKNIEPLISDQWFIKIKPLAKKAMAAVKRGEVKFVSKHFEKIFFHWLKNIKDWNISRQIVWGIPIPVWYCLYCNEVKINPTIQNNWFFVRHGETNWNKEKIIQGQSSKETLNQIGREQAKKAGQYLASKKVDLIISSDSPRAKETAKIIKKETGAELVFDKSLRERNYGILEERLSQELNEEERENLRRNMDYAPEGVESHRELEKRMRSFLQEHKKSHQHKNIVIVSHAGSLRTIFRILQNDPLGETRDIKNTEVVEFSLSQKCKKCGSSFFEQETDTFDTWFSSGQWPFAALLTQSGSKDFETFYPTSVMETGWDILFFWVARMIMLGIYAIGQAPFKYVYLHGLVRDKDRQKMSKSKGNVIDPLGVVNLYGADALRMALVFGASAQRDIIMSEDKIAAQQKFVTKIWNAGRFILGNLDKNFNPLKIRWQNLKLTKNDKWILKELKNTVKKTTKDIEQFRFHRAAEEIYHFFWHKFCDKTLEDVKKRLYTENNLEADLGAKLPKRELRSQIKNRQTAQWVLYKVLVDSLKLLHPFMPFITETIYQKLPHKPKKALIIEEWPCT